METDRSFGYIAIINECFLTLGPANLNVLQEVQSASRTSFAASIRHLLLSQHVNDIYLFLSCLECIDPSLWAGTKSDIPAVLEGWEVERVIALLDSQDVSIRKKVGFIYSSF